MYLQRRHGWCHMKLLLSQHVLRTPYNHAPCRFMQSHICKMYACLAVTCHLHIWQNDQGLLHGTAVTREGTDAEMRITHRKNEEYLAIFKTCNAPPPPRPPHTHIHKVYMCLAVTCHLHIWQDDRDLLRATAVTQGGTDTEIRVSTES